MIYVIKYTGRFAFIKPITSTKDAKTVTNTFLYPSSIIGIERHLFSELSENNSKKITKILGHRIDYTTISTMQEAAQAISHIQTSKNQRNEYYGYNIGIVERSVMINPILYLAFSNREDAEIARDTHICLSRNEDLMFSDGQIYELNNMNDFNNPNNYPGFELEPCIEYFDNSIKNIINSYITCSINDDNILSFGKNKYTQNDQYGKIKRIGEPSFTKYEQELSY
jgi:hypothetical protein